MKKINVFLYIQCIDSKGNVGTFLKRSTDLSQLSPTFHSFYELSEWLNKNYPDREWISPLEYTLFY